jgi:hypothetical protein
MNIALKIGTTALILLVFAIRLQPTDWRMMEYQEWAVGALAIITIIGMIAGVWML